MKPIFTKPKVSKPADPSKPWFVWFRYENKLKRYKLGINYVKDLKEREREANALADALLQKLKENWNPNIPNLIKEDPEVLFEDAINFALLKKKPSLKPKSYADYSCTGRFIIKAGISLKYKDAPIRKIKRQHIKEILAEAKLQQNWSNKAYNKHLNQLKAILSELLEWNVLNNNPAHKIKRLPVDETIANIPATPAQHKIIKEFLETKHPEFFVFIITIFHTGARPEEILNIRNEMINLRTQEIILSGSITKTKKDRIIPINNHLLKYFEKMNLHKYPKHYFVFGSFRQPGIGFRDQQKDFIPGPTKIKRDTATKRWNRLIKSETGLNINVSMYSNKHAGADAKILSGMELDVLRELYGHKSKLMTETYAKVVKEQYRKQIRENSPEF
ncbi:tyrosine-type recombinase/integrase [Flavobacterium sp. CYK-4]|uniref:tyrosine-type recombinase/integrase n=1 Tax=Flavobacterium lotistagni TaxID=2709660 RepID=UPI001408BA40|nr:tyrosine-type recombinase/integrase [Flavobacterium lotistagni]NHM08018.1 tyrosine-type recombinase/integrase [Flavobacterium lotistagni]